MRLSTFLMLGAASLVVLVCLSACGGGTSGSPAQPVAAPQIVQGPQNVTAANKGSASFSVTASGSGALSYQWTRNGSAIAGATGSMYTLSPVGANDGGARFAAIVSNSGGSATSAEATLSVTFAATSGVAQKGPLQLGSTVTAQELDAALSPTGKQYSYQTASNLGTFVPNAAFTARYIGLNANGYYFDEVTNAVSTGTVTLNGYSDLATDTVLNVNLLTTLAYQRIQKLVTQSSLTFTAARAQAEGEVLAAFGVPNASAYAKFGTLDLGQNNDSNHILAGISSVFVQGNTAGNLGLLIANVQADLGANGSIASSTTRAALTASARALDPEGIASNLNQAYGGQGVTFTATDISDWIDRDGDGLTGKFKFRALRATAASTFPFSAAVTTPYIGTSVSVSPGRMFVNGSAVTGSVTLNPGDVVAAAPDAAFSNGEFSAYLSSGTTRIGRATFAGHDTWSDGPRLATRRADSTAILLANGKVLVAGGFTGECNGSSCTSPTSLATSEIYDPATNAWSVAASMSKGRRYHTVTPLADGRVLVTGGYEEGASSALKSAEIYNPASNTWSAAADLQSPRMLHSATLLPNGKVLVVGGTTWEATPVVLATSEIYDPATNSWSPGGSLAAGRQHHIAISLANGTVLVVGGYKSTGGSFTTAEKYDPVANSWSSAGATPIACDNGFTASLLPNGKVLALGCGNGTASASADLYDPVANSWSPATSMTTKRSWHTAIVLPNGNVLVAGGFDSAVLNLVASAEIYNPGTNAWTAAASLPAARSGSMVVLLPNGMVLVAGGVAPPGTAGGTLLRSTVLYW